MLKNAVDTTAKGFPLPEKFEDHMPAGNCRGCQECHITSDRLLICEISEEDLILCPARTGTHSDTFSQVETFPVSRRTRST